MSAPLTKTAQASLILLLAGLAMLGPFSIDTIFPVFPDMQAAYGVDGVQMQQTISVYLGAYALMALLHGPLSDALGRRKVVLAGIVIFVIASVGCALADNLTSMLIFRALQGMSAGSGLIVGRAIVRDCFEGAQAQKVMSRITMVFGMAPALAPIIGGIIGSRLGWQAIFWFLCLLGGLLLVSCWLALPETHPVSARLPLAPKSLFGRYAAMLRNPQFVYLAFCGSFNFSALFIYISSAPTFVIQHLKLGATDFGYFFVPAILGMMIGAYFSGRRAGRHSPAKTIRLAYRIMFAAGLVNLAYCAMAPSISWPWAVIPVLVNGIGISLAFPTLTLLLLDIYPQERGTAASLQAFIQLSSSAIVAGLLSPLLAPHPAWLAAGALAASVLGSLCWRMLGQSTDSGRGQ